MTKKESRCSCPSPLSFSTYSISSLFLRPFVLDSDGFERPSIDSFEVRQQTESQSLTRLAGFVAAGHGYVWAAVSRGWFVEVPRVLHPDKPKAGLPSAPWRPPWRTVSGVH